MIAALESDGFAAIPARMPDDLLDALAELFASGAPGGRLADALPEAVAAALDWAELRQALISVDAALRPVRVLLLAKHVRANWFVPWHQDAAVAIEGEAAKHGFVNRTVKRGVAHWEAPASLLARMLAVRIHLDPAGPDNGPLEIVPGSHRFGFVDASSAQSAPQRVCTARRGDIHLVRPLLLHRSRRAANPGGRRTVQIELALRNALPDGLKWRLAA